MGNQKPMDDRQLRGLVNMDQSEADLVLLELARTFLPHGPMRRQMALPDRPRAIGLERGWVMATGPTLTLRGRRAVGSAMGRHGLAWTH